MKSLKLFLLLAISAFLQNCQQSDEPIEPEQLDFIVSNTDPSLNNELMEVLSTTVYGEEIENGRVMSSAIGDIDLNEAISAEHLGLGITRYTFRLETNEPYVFKNLILRKNQKDRFSGYIITYYPDLEWLAQNKGQLEMISFTGNVLFSSLQEKPIYWVVVNNGEGTVFSPKIASHEDGRIDCGGGSSPSGSGGSGPNHAGFWNSWVPTGGGSFDYAPDLPSGGGSGGGVIFIIIEIYEEEEPPADLLARTACDSGSPESFCPSDRSPDAVEGDANCPSNPIGVLGGDLSDYLADAWEEEVCLKENFSNNDCVNEIWNIMKDKNVGYETLKRFLGDRPTADLCLDIKNIGDANGEAVRSGNSVTINLNSSKLKRSKLSIARTLLHEMIHAELMSMVIEAGRYEDLQSFAQNYQGNDPFKEIWAYYDQYGSYMEAVRPGWQHEYMADHYIDYIADGLQELAPFLMSQAFFNYFDGEFFCPISDCFQWDWDDFYKSLAWRGLKETEGWKNKNDEFKEIYDKYASQLDGLESSSFKCQ